MTSWDRWISARPTKSPRPPGIRYAASSCHRLMKRSRFCRSTPSQYPATRSAMAVLLSISSIRSSSERLVLLIDGLLLLRAELSRVVPGEVLLGQRLDLVVKDVPVLAFGLAVLGEVPEDDRAGREQIMGTCRGTVIDEAHLPRYLGGENLAEGTLGDDLGVRDYHAVLFRLDYVRAVVDHFCVVSADGGHPLGA